MNTQTLKEIEVDGIDMKDALDFVDAFIVSAYSPELQRHLTQDELDKLNREHSDFVHDCVMKQIF